MEDITLVSDLHVDFYDMNDDAQLTGGKYLIIAGDTSNSAKKDAKFVNMVSERYEQIFLVDGNHTHYTNKYHDEKIRTIESNLDYLETLLPSNTILLRGDQVYDIGEGYSITGLNGWYSMCYPDLQYSELEQKEYWEKYMNDVYIWKSGSTHQPLPGELAKQAASKIRARLNETNNKMIVVTHTVPHDKHIVHKPWDQAWERANPFYINLGFEKIIKETDREIIWCHGHTHYRQETMVNNCRIICNPRGYPGENSGWSPIQL